MTTELKIELQQIINEKIVDSLKDIICINVLHSPCGSIMYIDKCNNNIAYILAKHKSFELKKDENKIGSIYKLGNILKSINIFIDETMEESSIYFFRKSKTSEPGLQIGIYKNGTNIAEVCNPFSYSNTIVSQLRFAIYDIGSSPEKSFKRITVNLQ
jgi:hypothetical protein